MSLKFRDGDVEFLRRDETTYPLELVYANTDRLREDKGQRVEARQLSPRAARILILGNDSDRELLVRLDEDSGDLCVTPSGRGARRGVLAARWNLPFAREAALVLPCINGMLIDAVLNATRELKAPVAFLDQTLCTWNTDNGLVENVTAVEGLRQMQEEFAGISPELVLAGEGANEISIQRQAFAQAHIHDGWGDLRPDHIAAAHPLCAYLWEGQTRLVGYYHVSPKGKDAEIGVEVYRKMGAKPAGVMRRDGLTVHAFERANGAVAVVWSARTRPVSVPPDVPVFDLMGNDMKVPALGWGEPAYVVAPGLKPAQLQESLR